MNVSYDGEADALYVRVADGIVDRTAEVATGTLVDVDNRGRLLGIEILRPARDWPIDELCEHWGLSELDAAQLRRLAEAGYPDLTVKRVAAV